VGVLGTGPASAGDILTLDEDFCTAGPNPNSSSYISGGTWDNATKTCTGDIGQVIDGDELAIPSDTSLVIATDFDVVFDAGVVNHGDMYLGSELSFLFGSTFENHGSVTVVERLGTGSASTCCGSVDNYGSITTLGEVTNLGDAFLNRCGSYFSAGEVIGFPTIEEPCPWPLAMVDMASGVWHLRVLGAIDSFYFGNPGDVPFMGDWDCDGTDTPGLYRQSDGHVYLRNSNTQGVADSSFFFGNPGDVPVAGDFNGDGCDTVSIYRPSQQRFYIINRLGTAGGGLGDADYSFVFGNPGDSPFVGDFNGDGQDTIGLHRRSTSLVYYRTTLTSGTADGQFIFGNPSDDLFANDWNKTGVDTPAAFRPATAKHFLRFDNSSGPADAVVDWGNAAWTPVAIHP
jgi:hypothetical protein